jgi:Uma2 family endonuclease
VTPSPGTSHQATLRNLIVILHHHAVTTGLGEVLPAPIDCILDVVTVVQPDIVFVDTARRSLVSERGIEGPPTLAVEILSPSSVGIDRRTKLRLYARYEVPHYWIVDPVAQTIEAYELVHGAYREAGTLTGETAVALPPFPGSSLDPRAIWPEPRRGQP